jgi:L,D-peptidoglycan transpeptidase YkuD (ErfK/YbiS/YcfS/YnhG family)
VGAGAGGNVVVVVEVVRSVRRARGSSSLVPAVPQADTSPMRSAPRKNLDAGTPTTLAKRGRRRTGALLAALVCVATLLAGCGGDEPVTVAATLAPTRATTTTTTTSTTVAPPTTTTPPAPPPAPTAAPAVPAPPAAPSDGQLIVVDAAGYGQSTATFTGYERRGGVWHAVLGPWPANIGRAGFAPAGEKREGDGRTPEGTYGFSFFFGIQGNPGVRYEYRPITDSAIVWDDDPASPNYNLWIDTRTGDGGIDPEPMYNPPAYDYGAVIAYNTDRVPGLGSAIFLHVSTGGATAGCVSLPTSQLLEVLRWLDPAQGAQIRMGVNAPPP